MRIFNKSFAIVLALVLSLASEKLFAQEFDYPAGYTFCRPNTSKVVNAHVSGLSGGEFSISPENQGVSVDPNTGDLLITNQVSPLPKDYTVSYTFSDRGTTQAVLTGDLRAALSSGDMASGIKSQAGVIYLSNIKVGSPEQGIYRVRLEGATARLTRETSLNDMRAHIALGPVETEFENKLFGIETGSNARLFYYNTDGSDNWAVNPIARISNGAAQLAFDSKGNIQYGSGQYVYQIDKSQIDLNNGSFSRTISPNKKYQMYDRGRLVHFSGGDLIYDSYDTLYITTTYSGSGTGTNSIIYKAFLETNSSGTEYFKVYDYLIVPGKVTGFSRNVDGCLYYTVRGARSLTRVHGFVSDCGRPSTISQQISVVAAPDGAEFNYPKQTFCSADMVAVPTLSQGNYFGTLKVSPSTGIVWKDYSLGKIDLIASEPGTYRITNTLVTDCRPTYTYEQTITISDPPALQTIDVSKCTGDVANVRDLVPNYQQLIDQGLEVVVYDNYQAAIDGSSEHQVDPDNIPIGFFYIRAFDPNSGCFNVLRADVLEIIAPNITVTQEPDVACDGSAVDLNTIMFTTNIQDPSRLSLLFFEDEQLTIPVPDPSNVLTSGIYWAVLRDNVHGCESPSPAMVTAVIRDRDIAEFDFDDFCEDASGRPVLDDGTIRGGMFAFRVEGSGDPFGVIAGPAMIDPGSGEIIGGVANVTYEVRYFTGSSQESLCPSTSEETVTVLEVPDPYFEYEKGTFCNSELQAAPTVIRTSGGVFSYNALTPSAQLDLNTQTGVVNVINSSIGDFEIKYAVSQGICSDEYTFRFSIQESPSASFEYLDGDFCQEPRQLSPHFTNRGSAGIFSASPDGLAIDASTGIIDLINSSPNTYTVTNTIEAVGACPREEFSSQVKILESPNIQVQRNIVFCQSAGKVDIKDPTYFVGDLTDFTLEFFDLGQANPMPLPPDDADRVLVGAGAYRVVITKPDGCMQQAEMNVIMLEEPMINILSQPSAQCEPASFDLTQLDVEVIYFNDMGGNPPLKYYTDSIDAVNDIDPIVDPTNVDGGPRPNGKEYFIRAENTQGCVTISDAINAISVPRDDASFDLEDYCEGSQNQATNIATPGGTFSFADTGLDYIPNSDNVSINTFTGEIYNGVGGETYSVRYRTNINVENPNAGVCPSEMDNDVTIFENPILIITDPPVACSPDRVDLTSPSIVDGSTMVGVTFSYYKTMIDAIEKRNPIPLNEARAIDAGTYYIRSENQDACFEVGAVVIRINSPARIDFSLGDEARLCALDQYQVQGVKLYQADSFEWTTDGSGTILNPMSVSPIYNSSVGDGGRVVNLILSARQSEGCTETVSDTFAIDVKARPFADAGTGMVICTTQKSVTLSGTALNGVVRWDSYGSGNFSNRDAINPRYYFDPLDSQLGYVDFELTVSDPENICISSSSDVRIELEQFNDSDFTYPKSTYCVDNVLEGTGNPPRVQLNNIVSPDFVASPGGLFSATPAGLNIDPNTGDIDLNLSDENKYLITYTSLPTPACSSQQTTIDFEIIETPNASFSYPNSSYCQSDGNPVPIVPVGSSIGELFSIPEGIQFANKNIGLVDLIASEPGQYRIVNQILDTVFFHDTFTICRASDTVDFEIRPRPDLVINDPSPICDGVDIAINTPDITAGTPDIQDLEFSYYLSFIDAIEGSGDNLVPNPSSVGGGNYYIRAVNRISLCARVDTINVIQNKNPDVTIVNPETVCKPGKVDITSNSVVMTDADNNLFFRSYQDALENRDPLTNAEAMAIDVTGEFFVRSSFVNTCYTIAGISVENPELQDPAFDFPDFCPTDDNMPEGIVTPGGVFSLLGNSRRPAVIDSRTGHISGFTPGSTYSVQYKTNGQCPDSTSLRVLAKNFDDASFIFNDFCFEDANGPNYIAIPGGRFSLGAQNPGGASIDAQTGVLSDYLSDATYEVVYNTTGAAGSICPNTFTDPVHVIQRADSSFYIEPFCADNPVEAIILGDLNGTFDFVRQPGDGAQVNPVNGMITGGIPGREYLVSYTTPEPCQTEGFQVVRVLENDDVDFEFDDFCVGVYAAPSTFSPAGGIFTLVDNQNVGEQIDPLTGRITNAIAGKSYKVQYTVTPSNGHCGGEVVKTVRAVNPLRYCPSDIVVNHTDPGICGAQVVWTEPVVSNSCDFLTITSNFNSGQIFPVGTTLVEYSIQNNSGTVIATCDFAVTVEDKEPPMILNDGEIITIVADNSNIGTVPDLKDVQDNCALLSVTQNPIEGERLAVGSYHVEIDAFDVARNASKGWLTLEIESSPESQLNCVDPVTVQADQSCRAPVVDLKSEFGAINPQLFNIRQVPEAGTLVDAGIVEVTLFGTNDDGGIDSCRTFLSIGRSPEAICEDIDIYLDFSGQVQIDPMELNGGSYDPCGSLDEVVFNAQRTSFSCADIGENEVKLTLTNSVGFKSSCLSVVNVIDTLSPVALAKDTDIYLDINGFYKLGPDDIDDGSFESCDRMLKRTVSMEVFECNSLGLNEVTLSVTDDDGNTSQALARVNVIDAIAPVVYCPDTIELIATPQELPDLVVNVIDSLRPEDIIENCTVQSLFQLPEFRTVLNYGDNAVDIVAIDQSNNVGKCKTIIRVNRDDIHFPSTERIPINENCMASLPDYGQQLTSMNPGVTVNFQSPGPGSELDLGQYTVLIGGVDVDGLDFRLILEVEVYDDIPPVAKCKDYTITLPRRGTAKLNVNDIDNGSYDNCAQSVNLELSKTEFGCDDLGVDEVVLTVTDKYGNEASCNAFVTVEPYQDELIQGCPADLVVNNTYNECGARVYWIPPTLVSDCGEITSNYKPGDFFNIGETTVEYRAFSGNFDQICTFTVTVNDSQRPEITCPPNITSCVSYVEVPMPEIKGNCNIIELRNSFNNTDNASGDYPVGDTTLVTWFVEDSAKRSARCMMTVEVAPKISVSLNRYDTTHYDRPIQFTPTVVEANRFSWMPTKFLNDPNIMNPICTPTESIDYTLSAWYEGYRECAIEKETSVFVIRGLDIPDVFTPDGDGINDTFEIIGISYYPQAKVKVYDRSGNELFVSSDGYEDEWDGRKNGSDLPVATYYYVIELNDDENNKINGIITIIR
ncbi:HYR domain-containing protein [Aureibacter tunicatorum]|uniref:Gliding motility-associated-like protein n=1 Tax=Aureibacter tunicatorum TaxID=866807 RepID=A0AAE3XH96_9BACT|nr:HYR domain-containing protein [Aureibacter tunicatorum]MDR6237636.1 gliding motility-associated-like protein [Aureibacter tunicatorum]BDD02671.1 hypothetical protein AUTU_01540 [Aureibacter tunicatorum]